MRVTVSDYSRAAAVLLLGCASFFGASPVALAMPVQTSGQNDDVVTDGSDDIVVIGNSGGSLKLTADALRDAAKAFRSHREEFAPASTLYLIVRGDAPPDLSFWLRKKRDSRDTDVQHLALTVDGDGRIALPVEQLVAGGWELRTNRTGETVELKLWVASSGTTVSLRRFGDLRLQCRASLAFARLNFAARGLAGAVGPCASSHFAVYEGAAHPIASVQIEGASGTALVQPDGLSWRVPLSDKGIGNSAWVTIRYR